MNKIFAILFISVLTACASESSNNTCNPCAGDKRIVACTNTKPQNSSWGETNPDGMLEQTYAGMVFLPPENSCGWICNTNYIREGNKCVIDDETIIDTDGDNVSDLSDNCKDIFNPLQENIDGDSLGDVCDSDIDNDGILNDEDNCKEIANFNQENTDNDEFGNICDSDIDNDGIENNEDECPTDSYNLCNVSTDSDNDGIVDESDNCPDIANANQLDTDDDNIGDVCETQTGTKENPIFIDSTQTYTDLRNTNDSNSSEFGSYPPNSLDESGPEFVYMFLLTHPTTVKAYIRLPEPANTDIDLHLLSSLNPLTLVERGNAEVNATLNAGVYYIIMDTYVDNGTEQKGEYFLTVEFSQTFLGTMEDPIELSGSRNNTPLTLPFQMIDTRVTTNSESDVFDNYYPDTLDESGNEYIYKFTIDRPVRFYAALKKPEPTNTDIDLHLIKQLNTQNPELVVRGDVNIYERLQPGTYYIVADTYVSSGVEKSGSYTIDIMIRSIENHSNDENFNYYLMEAVYYLYYNHGLLGYDIGSVLTHDVSYGQEGINPENYYGIVPETGDLHKTMCVAAVMEVMLIAFDIYVEDTGDWTVYNYLPLRSWKIYDSTTIKGHIWVNHDWDSWGTADAVRNFGMGENEPFEELKPGSFFGINRTTGSGHATIFLAFLDKYGHEYTTYPNDIEIIGFKYFSSQGGYDIGNGGFDYRYAVFSKYQTSAYCSANPGICDSNNIPIMPYKRDANIIMSVSNGIQNQNYTNTGSMFSPHNWHWTRHKKYFEVMDNNVDVSTFDSNYFNGVTTDD